MAMMDKMTIITSGPGAKKPARAGADISVIRDRNPIILTISGSTLLGSFIIRLLTASLGPAILASRNKEINKTMKTVTSNNDAFVRKNLESLVKKYPRQRVVICNKEIFTGENAVQKARIKYPKSIPLSMPVPSPEEFTHLL
jgi:hypothetical protein